MENELTQENDLSELLASLNDDEPSQEVSEEQTNKALDLNEFNEYKNASETRIKELENELKTLKETKEPEEIKEQDSERQSVLKELGLDGLDEKLKYINEFEAKQKQRESQEALALRFAKLESELRKTHPSMDLKALSEIGAKLEGLKDGDLSSWNTLINIINKANNTKKADDLSISVNANKKSEFNEKLKKGEEINDIDLGQELMSLMGD